MLWLKKSLFRKTQIKPLYLQNIIKPLYVVTKLFGLFPYSVTFNKSRKSFVLIRKSIYFNSLCAVSICLIVLIFFGLHIQELVIASENINLGEAILTEINYVLELVTFLVFCIAAYIGAFLNRTKYVKMLNQITATWYELPRNTSSKQILINLRFQVNVVCFGSICVITVTRFIVNYTRQNTLWKMILVTFTFDLLQTIQFVALAFYYILVMMVVTLLMNINWHCHQLLKHHTNAVEGFVQVPGRPALNLRQMELIYVRAFEIKTEINEAFQGPILATTLQSFHAMVSESHIIYHGLFIHKSMSLHEVVNCSLWIMYQLLKIYCFAYSGNLLKEQAMKIPQILHKIPTENLDDRWLMEMQHFSTLIYYQNIELSVYGYFPLNATLVYNMLASVTMYLIILVQFDGKRD